MRLNPMLVSGPSHPAPPARHRTRPDPLQVGQIFRPLHTGHLTVPRPVFRLPSPPQAKHRRLPLQPGQSRDTAQPPFTFTQVAGTFVRIRRSVTGGSDRRIATRTVWWQPARPCAWPGLGGQSRCSAGGRGTCRAGVASGGPLPRRGGKAAADGGRVCRDQPVAFRRGWRR